MLKLPNLFKNAKSVSQNQEATLDRSTFPAPRNIKFLHGVSSYVVGKTLAFTSTRLLNQQNELVARGSHTKFVAMAWKDPGNRVEEIALEEAAASDSAKP